MSEIPIIDVKGLSEKEEDLQEFAARIRKVFTSIGFIGICNHNIQPKVVSRAWEKVNAFFDLPKEVKVKYKRENVTVGWGPIGSQKLYNPGHDPLPPASDFKETLDLNTNGTGFRNVHILTMPTEIPDIEEATNCLNLQFMKLGIYFAKLLAIALNLQDRDFFVKRHNVLSQRSTAALRFAQYPPIPEGGLIKGQMRCGQHTDFGTITLLIQDEYGGLEVKKKDGTWIETHPPPGTVMVNIGDMMQRWTSDLFVSNYHRVREPEEEHLKNRTRRSVVYFFNADDDTIVESLDGSQKYAPISASQYLNHRLDIARENVA